MFYLVAFQYFPNTASTNRIEAYMRALSELKVPTRVVFFLPDKDHSRFTEILPNIEIAYMWDRWLMDLPRLNKISLCLYVKLFVKKLNQGDKILVYGFPDLVVALSQRYDLSLFVETTEHPDASFSSFLKGTSVPGYLKACSKAKGVIVISNTLRNYFIENGCRQECVHVVNMIVDQSRFENTDKQPSHPYIAYCGNASNTKDGVDQLIKAFAIVVKQHPDYKLYIIGNKPSSKQPFNNLELAKKLGIEDSVEFTGVVSAQEMPQMLKNASILALDRPDNLQAKYGFPTKLGEYLLTGNPVVVTRVGDIPMFLEDGRSALIATPEKPQAFADKICWAIEHTEEACVIGAAEKKVAERHFNYLIETQKLICIIQNR